MRAEINKTLLIISLIIGNIISGFAQDKPNFIIILADDLGYGDLSCYGHPTIRTPNLDQMAKEGMRFTQFYTGAALCSPSRAALLTGRLAIRTGVYGEPNVFRQNSASGLPLSEVTIAEMLKAGGYSTGIIGKWHLGHLKEFLPTKQGFDYWFGVPYSNDMGKVFSTLPKPDKPNELVLKPNNPPLPLYRNDKVIEEEPDQTLLTKRYAQEALEYIKKNKAKPFFLYFASNAPHTPLYASSDFKSKSKRGIYGDVVEELDWSVGQILKTLKELKLDNNTFVVFTSDNGPWLTQREHGGSAGTLYEGKNSTYEGGMRVPAIAWWPGKIKANVISTSVATTMDMLPTFASLSKTDLPKDKISDGVDISDLLFSKKNSVRNMVYYYINEDLYAIRKGVWKAHFTTHASNLDSKEAPVKHTVPLLYNIEVDPSEKYNIAKQHPDIVEDLKKEYDKQQAIVAVPSEIDKIIGSGTASGNK